MEWVVWLLVLWAVFSCGAVAGTRFAEVNLRQRERQVAARRAELDAFRREVIHRGVRDYEPAA